MKFNNEIRILTSLKKHETDRIIYDYSKASRLFNCGKHGYKELSLMKQENIRCALKSKKYTLADINEVLIKKCGFCFHFFNCVRCPLKVDCCKCYILKEYEIMRLSTTKKKFAKYHKAWCKRLGLWQERWV